MHFDVNTKLKSNLVSLMTLLTVGDVQSYSNINHIRLGGNESIFVLYLSLFYYIKRMRQGPIYYVATTSYKESFTFPFVQRLHKKGL